MSVDAVEQTTPHVPVGSVMPDTGWEDAQDASSKKETRIAPFILLLCVIFALLVARKPDTITNPQFWAEDGKIFFQDQLTLGLAHSLVRPYLGYFQPVQRVTAGMAALFPLAYSPLIYSLTALAIAALCCSLFSLPHYRSLISSDGLRVSVCLVISTAFYSDELIGILTNVHWFLFLAGVLLVSAPPATDGNRCRSVLWCAAGFLLGFSAPMLIIVAPFAVFHLSQENWSKASLPIAVTAGAFLPSIVATVIGGVQVSLPYHSFLHIVRLAVSVFVNRVLVQSLVGFKTRVLLSQSHAAILTAQLGFGFLIWIGWLWRRLSPQDRTKLGAAVYLIASSIAVAIPVRNVGQLSVGLIYAGERGERYFFLGACILVFLIAMSFEKAAKWRPSSACAAFVILFLGGVAGNFRIAPLQDLAWPKYSSAIRSWVAAKRSGGHTATVSIPINPLGWEINLPAQ